MSTNLTTIFNDKLRPINDGQKALMILISKKYEKAEQIEYEELEKIYHEKVQRNKKYWSYYHTYDEQEKRWYAGYEEYEKWQLDILVTSWVLRSIGTLVKKGYLTVIPKINLSRLEQ